MTRASATTSSSTARPSRSGRPTCGRSSPRRASPPDLNGRVAAAATFDKASGRYRAEGLAPHTVALRPEHVVLPPRTRVEVSGVSSRPTLNGQLGAIVGADAERYTVQLPHETVRLRFGAVAAC